MTNQWNGNEQSTSSTQIVNVASCIPKEPVSHVQYISNSAYTLEQHLHSFVGNEQYSYLWHSWNVEKCEYIRQLETINKTYHDYSLHDANHSEKIIEYIERLLGPSRIRMLSPSDTWLILQCAYTHDLGMCVTETEKMSMFSDVSTNREKAEQLQNDANFREYIDILRDRRYHYPLSKARDVTKKAAEFWNRNLNKLMDKDLFLDSIFGDEFNMAKFYFNQVVEEGFRTKHADRSCEYLLKRLYENVEYDIIPAHMRRAVAEIDKRHCGDWRRITDLKHIENGFNRDYIHPRFAASLLRLGDLLDLDSTRFNPYNINYLAKISNDSASWMVMNFAVSEILVNEKEICITANYETKLIEAFFEKHNMHDSPQNTNYDKKRKILQLIASSVKHMRNWMYYITINAQELRLGWDSVAPVNFPGCIAVPAELRILRDGVEIDTYDNDLKYEIDPSRAAYIIEGAGLYRSKTAFLREIIQNAVDATKRQIYRDIYKTGLMQENTNIDFMSFLRIMKHLKHDYDINVSFSMENRKKSEDCMADTLVVSIEDKGIGITRNRLDQMKNIGAVNDKEMDEELKNMPEWLRPTGDFGIGMQSVFLVAEQFMMKSCPRKEEFGIDFQRRIIFNSTQLGGDISNLETKVDINDTRKAWSDSLQSTRYPYGTLFRVNIDLTKPSGFTRDIIISSQGAKISEKESRLNLPYLLVNYFQECIKQTFINEIVPINFKYSSEMIEDDLSFIKKNQAFIRNLDTLPFEDNDLTATRGNICIQFKRKDEKGETQTVSPEIIYFWYDKKSKTNTFNKNRLDYAMLKLECNKDGSGSETRLFFRGIRFEDRQSMGGQRLSRLFEIPGFNCDINIMSGKASEYIEINREHVKNTNFDELRVWILDCFKAFYDEVIKIINEEDNHDSNNICGRLSKIIGSSPGFANHLLMYIFALRKHEQMKKAEDILIKAGGTIDSVWFDMHEGIVCFNQEHVSFLKLMSKEPRFVDYFEHEKSSYISLKKYDHRSRNLFGFTGDCFNALRNTFPLLYNLKYDKVLAFESRTSNHKLVKLYSLTTEDGYTRMDEYSFFLIIKQIIKDCEQRIKLGEINSLYVPVFPAFRCVEDNKELLPVMNNLCVDKLPAGANLDDVDRYNGVVLSPLPAGIFKVCLKYPNAVKKLLKDLTKTIDPVRTRKSIPEYINEQLNNIDTDIAAEDKNESLCAGLIKALRETPELTGYYDALFAFTRDNAPQHAEQRSIETIAESCQHYVEYLNRLINRYMI